MLPAEKGKNNLFLENKYNNIIIHQKFRQFSLQGLSACSSFKGIVLLFENHPPNRACPIHKGTVNRYIILK